MQSQRACPGALRTVGAWEDAPAPLSAEASARAKRRRCCAIPWSAAATAGGGSLGGAAGDGSCPLPASRPSSSAKPAASSRSKSCARATTSLLVKRCVSQMPSMRPALSVALIRIRSFPTRSNSSYRSFSTLLGRVVTKSSQASPTFVCERLEGAWSRFTTLGC